MLAGDVIARITQRGKAVTTCLTLRIRVVFVVRVSMLQA